MNLLLLLKQGNQSSARKLIEKCSLETINFQDEHGLSALHYCVLNQYHALCEALLVAGADVHACARINHCQFMTPLHVAAQIGDRYLVALLLLWGADRDAENGAFQTPAKVALRYQHSATYDLLAQPKTLCHSPGMLTFLNPSTKQYCLLATEAMIAKRMIELHNSSPEAEQTRRWLSTCFPSNHKVIDFINFKYGKKKLNF